MPNAQDIVTTSEIIKQLGEAFGFDPSFVTDVSVHIPADDVVTIEIHHIVLAPQLNKLVEILKLPHNE